MSWQLLIRSGSDAFLNSLNVATDVNATSLTGSLDWSNLDNVPSLSGSQDLQSVTDNGNTTTNNVLMTGSANLYLKHGAGPSIIWDWVNDNYGIGYDENLEFRIAQNWNSRNFRFKMVSNVQIISSYGNVLNRMSLRPGGTSVLDIYQDKVYLQKHLADVNFSTGSIDDILLRGSSGVEWTNQSDITAGTASYVASASYTPNLQQVTDQGNVTVNSIEANGARWYAEVDYDGNDIESLGNILFQTGAQGGKLRTGTSNADVFRLQAYDNNDTIYRDVIDVNAGNDPYASLNLIREISFENLGGGDSPILHAANIGQVLDITGSLQISGSLWLDHHLYDSNNSSGSVGQFLKSTTNGIEWGIVAGGDNFYLTGSSFNTGNGELSLFVSGALDVVQDLDGRYLQTSETASWAENAETSSYIDWTNIDNAPVTDIGTDGPDGTLNLDFNQIRYYRLGLRDSITINLATGSSTDHTLEGTIEIRNSGISSLTWDSNIWWPGGSTPTNPGVGEFDIYKFEWNGENWINILHADNVS